MSSSGMCKQFFGWKWTMTIYAFIGIVLAVLVAALKLSQTGVRWCCYTYNADADESEPLISQNQSDARSEIKANEPFDVKILSFVFRFLLSSLMFEQSRNICINIPLVVVLGEIHQHSGLVLTQPSESDHVCRKDQSGELRM